MHKTVSNLISIEDNIKLKFQKEKQPNIVAISKTFALDKITPLIEYGHFHFGENKVQEAVNKWSEVKNKNKNINLHLVGKLQTNKVKLALSLFDYIHSLDNFKLAQKIADEQHKQKKNLKLFIQVNIGEEIQKSGLNKNDVHKFYNFCKSLNLNVIGLMCIPPLNSDSGQYFKKLKLLNDDLNLSEISMGMSSDYLEAIKYGSTYVRIGSNIFGNRN